MRRVRESQRGIGGEGKKNGLGVNNTTQKDKGFRAGDCRTTGRGSGAISLLLGSVGLEWIGCCLMSPNRPRAPTPPWVRTAESKVKGSGDGWTDGRVERWNFFF